MGTLPIASTLPPRSAIVTGVGVAVFQPVVEETTPRLAGMAPCVAVNQKLVLPMRASDRAPQLTAMLSVLPTSVNTWVAPLLALDPLPAVGPAPRLGVPTSALCVTPPPGGALVATALPGTVTIALWLVKSSWDASTKYVPAGKSMN